MFRAYVNMYLVCACVCACPMPDCIITFVRQLVVRSRHVLCVGLLPCLCSYLRKELESSCFYPVFRSQMRC